MSFGKKKGKPSSSNDDKGSGKTLFRKCSTIVQTANSASNVWTDRNKLFLAIQADQYDEVSRMLSGGLDPNEKNTLGNTALHTASKTLSKDIMELLIASGADVNFQNDNKMTPLHFVVLSRGGDPSDDKALECLKLLLKNNADVNLQDHSGATALHLSAIRSEEKWVDALVQGGASLCAKMDDGTLALYYVMKNCPNSIRRCLDACFLGFDGNLNKDKLEAIIKSSDKEKSEIKLDFTHLQSKSTPSSSNIHDPTTFYEKVLDMKNKDPTLNEIVKDTFLHPSSQAYIYYKWCNVVWWYYIFILFAHFVYCIVFSTYATLVFRDICDQDETKRNKWMCKWNIPEKAEDSTKRQVATICWIMLIPFTGILLLKQISMVVIKIWKFQKKEYSSMRAKIFEVTNLSSIFAYLVILSFCLGSFHEWPSPNKESISLQLYQYHVIVYGVFLAWLDMMLLWGKATKVGLYVKLLIKVATTFTSSIYAYLPLFIAFTLSFYILFPNMKFAENLPFVILKVRLCIDLYIDTLPKNVIKFRMS